MKLKQLVPSGKQFQAVKKVASAAKGTGVLDKLKPSRNGDEEQQEGVGDGRRMPIQQSVDIAVPVEDVWKLWNKHKLAPRLTRVELSLDVNPHGPIEKIGRGMRFTKRAVRADLHRFKAYAEMNDA
jgi:uncharacterized membrane protein